MIPAAFLLKSVLRDIAAHGRCPRRLRWLQSGVGTEPLEIRRLLTEDFLWAKGWGGAGIDDRGMDVAVDAAGNVYTTGVFSGTVDFDPGAGVVSLTSAGGSDVFVSKLNSAGNQAWAVRMGSPTGGDTTGNDEGLSITVDTEGNVYTTGFFSGTADFNPSPAGVFNLTSAGGKDIFVSKLDTAGNFVWAKRMGGLMDDVANAIAVDAAGSIYTTGNFQGTVDFNPSAEGVANLTSAGGTDIFVSKLNTAGNFVLSRRMGGASNDVGRGIAVDTAGNICTVGSFQGIADFNPGVGIFNLTYGNSDDIFVSKLNSAGNFVWANSMFGLEGGSLDGGNDIAVDASGSVYVTGFSGSTILFDAGDDVPRLIGPVGFVAKLDSGGSFIWAKGMSNSGGFGIAVDSAGNVFTTGFFSGTADFDPGAGIFNLTSSVNDPTRDVFVLKLDNEGDFLWARGMGGRGDDNGEAIAVDITGNVRTTGWFNLVADFNPGTGAFNLTSSGGGDVFVSKLSPDLLFTLKAGLTGNLLLKKNGVWLELYFSDYSGTGEYVLQDRYRLAAVRAVRITDNGNSNALTLDYLSGGGFGVDGGIHFAGGGGAANEVRLIGAGNEGFTYQPSAVMFGTGKFVTYGKQFNFTDVRSVFVTNTQHLTVEPQGYADVITASEGTGFQDDVAMTISGTSSGTAFPPITFDNVRDLTIDTGLRDDLLVLSHDVVRFDAGSVEARGLKNVFVRTGKGNDSLTLNGPYTGLPVVDDVLWFFGGTGTDLLAGIGDTNWDLNDTRLVSSGGRRILFDDVEVASLTGGGSPNHLNASAFSGNVRLDGVSGNDLLRGGSGNDTFFGGTGDDRILGGPGNDWAYGQDGNDQLWGEAGEDTLYGTAGNDQLWGGDDNDWMTGEAGDDVLQGGNGDDTINGGDNSDRLFGDAGNDILNGGTGNDQLNGGSDNDTLIGSAGADLYVLEWTNNSKALELQRVSATSSYFRRKPRGLVSVLELDTITMDASDEFHVSALGGDDLIAIDALFTQLGSIDGGEGTDSCTAPAAWTKVSC